jgi:hypothetical protein
VVLAVAFLYINKSGSLLVSNIKVLASVELVGLVVFCMWLGTHNKM